MLQAYLSGTRDTTVESQSLLCEIGTMKHLLFLLLTFSALACAAPVEQLKAPPGFTIEQLNFSVPNARQLALTENGTLIVGSRRAGRVYAVPDALTAQAPQVITLFTGLDMPSGVTVHNGDVYIGALNQIIRVADIDNHLTANPPHTVITDTLPNKTHHGWKYLKFGPDGYLYVPVGAPCNICLSDDPRFASLLRMDPNTGETEVWAHGVRNTVGFDWHPGSNQLYFTDNGRDMMGDDVPAEEVNRLTEAGQHFGYPFVHAGGVADPEFGNHSAAQQHTFTPPVLEIQAHSAALGIDFYAAQQFPATYQHALFIAEHGSWNRSSKVGYQVSVAFADANGSLRYEPFVTGWLNGEDVSGRPNDVMVSPDGSLLISDDQNGVVYRVTYRPPST